jgi:hypothetical protein
MRTSSPLALGTRRLGGTGLVVAFLLASPAGAQAQDTDERPHVILTSPEQRHGYLATARVWQHRELPTPEQIVEGPPFSKGRTRAQLNPPGGIPCTYESGGARMGGKTPKFTCRADDGRSIRVKYFNGDPRTGNREVFAEVIATRLFWALGFDADRVYPLTVNCRNCPADPMNGNGPRADRTFLGVSEAPFTGLLILSKADVDQGWKFGDFEDAIDALPAGPSRDRQRMYFDALRTLAAFVQHGDRKPEQQRLVCVGDVDLAAGDVHHLSNADGNAFSVPALFERPNATSCATPVAMIQDLGATFGSSGRITTRSNKVHLDSWVQRRVFRPTTGERGAKGPACRLDITAALTAGGHATATEPVTEAGRRFVAEQLARLTDAHIRALFEAARLDAFGERVSWTDARTGQIVTGVDAWVAAFKFKRDQIAQARCGGSAATH